ncbi:MAG: beta-lactamase family protein [Bacteriovoracaceae bacterium]|nr:beta-lactamase family protein [Bacteriovoracaceae bacterium]
MVSFKTFRILGLTFSFVLFLYSIPSFSISKPDRYGDYWPTKSWRKKSLEEAGFDRAKFQKLLDYVWEDEGNHKSDAYVVIKDGYVVYEGYDRGYNPKKKHMFWSFSKSLTSTVIGAAIQQGHLTLQTKVKDFYPEMDREKARDVTLRHVLNMSSGFKFYEENPINIALSDSIFVYYSKDAYKDVALKVAKTEMKFAPDEQFNYGTHEPMLAMGILKKAINNISIYENFPWDALFTPLNMSSVVYERDQSKTFLGGSGGWGVAKDYAKLGFLMLNNGVWEGKRILPEWWSNFATRTVAPALVKRESEEGQERLNVESYGAYWWLNKKLKMNKQRPYPNAPDDLYQAMGFRGQTMGVIPSKGLIIVRMGSDGRKPKKKLKRDKMYKLLLDSLVEEK